jgi:hypothetical protein
MNTTAKRLTLRVLPMCAALLAACAQEAEPLPDDLLADEPPIASVPGGAYIAVRTDLVEIRVTDGDARRAAFRLPGGGPFAGGLSYLIVDLPDFAQLPGARRYVVIDPARGLDPSPAPIDPMPTAGEDTTRVQSALGACDLGGLCNGPLTIEPEPPPADLVGSPFHRGPAPEHVVTVENRGAGNAGPSSAFVDFGPTCRNHVATPPLAAGSWVLIDLGLPERCFRPGVHYSVRVDEYNAVPESDETNNTFSSVILGTPTFNR